MLKYQQYFNSGQIYHLSQMPICQKPVSASLYKIILEWKM